MNYFNILLRQADIKDLISVIPEANEDSVAKMVITGTVKKLLNYDFVQEPPDDSDDDSNNSRYAAREMNITIHLTERENLLLHRRTGCIIFDDVFYIDMYVGKDEFYFIAKILKGRFISLKLFLNINLTEEEKEEHVFIVPEERELDYRFIERDFGYEEVYKGLLFESKCSKIKPSLVLESNKPVFIKNSEWLDSEGLANKEDEAKFNNPIKNQVQPIVQEHVNNKNYLLIAIVMLLFLILLKV